MRVKIKSNVAFGVFVGGLFALSAFFVASVELRRHRWSSSEDPTAVESGAEVEVVQVIDGDEVSVTGELGAFVVRLQGIKAFSSARDFEIGPIGRTAVEALRGLGQGGKVAVVFAEHHTDRAGRLIGYLDRDGTDLGLELVKRGLVLVYTKYPFDRERDYEAAELKAKTRAVGLWGNTAAARRADDLQDRWKSERQP